MSLTSTGAEKTKLVPLCKSEKLRLKGFDMSANTIGALMLLNQGCAPPLMSVQKVTMHSTLHYKEILLTYAR